MGQKKEVINPVKISDCKSFISILLKGTATQAKSLLLLASNREIRCVVSILYAILSLPVSKHTQTLLSQKKNITIIKALSNKSTKLNQQRKIFRIYHKRILLLLRSLKNRLLQQLS